MTPWKPKQPCTTPGCNQLCDGRKCEHHRQQERRQYDAGRATDPKHTFYASKRWRAIRAAHLASEPLCRECRKQGRVVAADTVDHIQPISRMGNAYDDSNLQSLCAPCHSAKSIREGSRYGR
jgi:5-methylcytosine-specific restriction protein A